MAEEFSFDVVSKVDLQEVDNAVQQALKEILNRFDFKGSKSQIVWSRDEGTITLVGDDEFKLGQVKDIVEGKLVKRGISMKALDYGAQEPAASATVRQVATLRQGIAQEKAKPIVQGIKELKLKVQSHIQGDQIRISSRSKDELQTAMQFLREKDFGIALQFTNYR